MTKDKFKKGKIIKNVLSATVEDVFGSATFFPYFILRPLYSLACKRNLRIKGEERNPCHKVFFLSFGTALGCSLEEDDGGMHDEASTNKKVAMFTHTLTFAWR